MRFFIAALVAFAMMTIDFESFKLSYGLQGTTRGAFTVAAGHVGEEDKAQSAEHSIGTEDAVSSEPVAEVEVPTPMQAEPKRDFCDALKEAAESSDIPIAFFARLLWQASRFPAYEVSGVGAQGVAQLAAAAYNAGSARIQKWLSRRGALPRETRDYVRIITGNVAENWLEESTTLSLHLELPRGAPCEGVGGLST